VAQQPPVNGRELTADDVVFSVNHFLTVKGNANAYMLKAVDKVEAPDKYTVKFTLKEPFVWFLDMISNPHAVAIVAKEVLDKHGDFKNGIGHRTGPGCSTRTAPTSGSATYATPTIHSGAAVHRPHRSDGRRRQCSRMAAFLSGQSTISAGEFPGTINRVDWVQIKDTLKQSGRSYRPSSSRRR